MKRRRALTEEDSLLWRKVATTVRPLHPQRLTPEPAHSAPPKAAPSKAKPSARPVRAAVETRSPAQRDLAAEPTMERRVRRGRAPIEARLDLHGDRQGEAEARLSHFLKTSHALGRRCVLVITGKGDDAPRVDIFAEPRGVLRRRLPDWLAAPERRDMVSGFAPAHRRHGGDGAFYVFLKKPRSPGRT